MLGDVLDRVSRCVGHSAGEHRDARPGAVTADGELMMSVIETDERPHEPERADESRQDTTGGWWAYGCGMGGMMGRMVLWCVVGMIAAAGVVAFTGVRIWPAFCMLMMVAMMWMMMAPGRRHH